MMKTTQNGVRPGSTRGPMNPEIFSRLVQEGQEAVQAFKAEQRASAAASADAHITTAMWNMVLERLAKLEAPGKKRRAQVEILGRGKDCRVRIVFPDGSSGFASTRTTASMTPNGNLSCWRGSESEAAQCADMWRRRLGLTKEESP